MNESQTAYDFRQYDRIWKRVAPTIEPYPREETGGETMAPITREGTGGEAMMPMPRAETNGEAMLPLARETQLPGADRDPCCMGSAAADMLNVLTGFIEEELADRWRYLALLRLAPAWARNRLRELAQEEGDHAHRLMAVYYLITGNTYCAAAGYEHMYMGRWCPALRDRYHAEACNGLNYARAAEGSTDPCLTRLLEELSRAEYRQAEELMGMLERSLQL